MTEFTIRLSTEDTERLYALKKEAGKNDLSGNDYARQMLIKYLHREYPEQVKYDDMGEIMPRKKRAAI